MFIILNVFVIIKNYYFIHYDRLSQQLKILANGVFLSFYLMHKLHLNNK